MNKVYKVIWNASIGAWVATSEIAKSKTKTKSKTLNVSAAVLSGVICFAPNAFAGTNTEGGIGQGTSISGTTSCREGSANTANQKDIAIGCGAQTQDRTGSNIANRNNPYNNSTGAYAGAMKQGGAISVGTGAVVEKGLGTAIGSYATTQGISGVAIGTGALSSGNTALAVGRQSAATADFSQAIGNVAAATGKGSLAIGHSATAEGYRSIAIGSPDIENADPVAGQAGAAYQPKMATKATGKDSIAFGGGAVATEENALAIGAFSESKGKKSVAIGTGAKAQKDNAVVIGDQAEASFEGGVAIGKGARSEAENSIALGKDSKASQATGESFLTKQSAPTGVLSIGDIGTERRIQNVADGAADSDAATVRQLKAARTHYVSINDNGQPGGNFENDGATGRNAIAVGVNASAAGREAMAIGGSAQAIGSGAIAMGSSSQTVGRGDVAIGRNASTQGAEGVNSNQSVAIGDQTKAIGDQSVAIGADVIAKGNSSVAIGGDDVDKIARDTELSNTYTEITGGTLQAGKYPTTEANHGSTAVGVQAVGTGAFSSAFGMTSKATGDASSAFGVMSNASGKGAAAFGAVAQATGDGASAMGINSFASGINSTAIGSGNKPGEGAKATGNSAAAIGSGAQATGDNSAAIGKGAEATNENAAAVGGGAKAAGKNAAAIGGGAIADQENAVAVGQGAQSLVEGGVALGARSKVEAKNSVALGQDAVATEATGTSFLTNRDASQSNGVISVGSAGKERRITNVEDGSADSDAVTVRQLKNVDSRVNQNTSNIGKNTQNITNLNQKLDDTKTNLGNQITDTNKNLNDAKKDLGDQIADTNTKLNTTKDQLTTQINDTKTELNNTIGNTKTELNSKIDSTKTELENKGLNFAGNSGADVHRKLGEKLNIIGGAAASTPAAKTSGENVITRTTQDGIQIELLKDSKFDSVTTGNTTLNTNGLTIKEGPSITKDGINAGGKKITNVADGINAKDAVNKSQLDNLAAKQHATDDAAVKYDDAKTKDKVTLKGKDGTVLDNVKAGHISSTSKEAVNGSQIHKISNSIKNSIGGNTVVNPDGSLTTNNIGGTGKNNINDAISEVKNTATKAKTTVTEGDNIVVKETVNKDGSTNYEVSTKKDLTLNSVTTGDSVLNNNGLTIKEGASITKEGINAGGKQITNVADGINAKDAVNVDQLSKVKENLNGRITDTNNQLNDAKKDLGNQIADTNKNLNDAKKDLGNQITDTNTKLNTTKDELTTQINDTKTELNNTIGNTKTELNTKIDNTKTELENKGLNFAGNSGADVHRKLGEKLNIVGGAVASTPASKTSGENVITRTTQDGIQIELLKDSKFDSVTTGNTTLNTNGLTIKEGPSITKQGINAGGKQITNVADGINAKDAVNKSQLDNLAAKQNATDDAAVKYDDAKTKDKVTLKGKDGTVLDNVKAGHISSTSKEAVNGSQIHKISNSIKNSIGGNTVVNPDGSLTTNNIGGTGKNNINDAISEVKNTATKAKTTVTEGDNIVVKETVNKDGSTNYEVSTKKDLTLNSVTTGDSVLNNNGLTIKEGPSITKEGINAGGKQITNVADGINAKDAVNVDQLSKVKENLNGRITDTNNQLNDAKKDLGNQIADTNTKLNNTKDQLTTQINDTKTELNNTIGNTKTELNSKIDSTKTELENKGLNFAGNSGSDVHRKLGEKLYIVGGAAASTPAAKTSGENVITRTTKDGIQIELLKDSKFDSVTTGNTTLNTNGLTIKEGPSITKQGINAGGKKITNVADGINAKDAVNKSQLDNLAAKQNATDDAAVKYDDAKTKDKVTLKGKDGTVLDNVKAGHISSTSKEAVNGSQIHNISNSIKNSIVGNTVVNPDGSLTTNNIGGTGKNNINDAISEVKNTATKAKTTVTEGDNIVVKETVNKDGSTNYEVSTKKDLTLNSVTTGDSVLNNNGLTIKDGPSITKDGINAGGKKITDVANGVIAQNSKDAVNGGQVHHISNSIKNSIGGNTVVNPDGSLTTNNIGGTGKNNINDAIKSVDEKVTNGVNDLTQKGLNFGANDQKATQGKAVHRKLGDTINIVGGADAKTAEDKTSGENIITRTTEDGVKIEMLKDVKFDSMNVGGHVLNQQGLTIKGGPSITVNGINAGGKQITNVADGINAKDAVNKGQLDKQINEVKDQIGKDIGKLSDHAVQYDKDKNGNVDKNSVTLGGGEKGTNLKNVADGKVAEGSKDAVNGGQLWNIQNQVDKNSNDIKNIQNNIDNISNGKAGLVQQQKPNGEITVGKDTGGTSINMAGKEGDRVVQGVKDGEIKAGSNQAVNGGQIHKISESIKNSIGGNTTIDPKDGSITTNNIGGTGKNNINDAIGTLNQSNQELGNKITNLGDQLQQVFYDTNKRIDDVEKKANAGIAAAMALENAPFVAGKYTYAVGAAYHGGENAVGVTLRKTSDNGRWSITGGVAAASQGEPSVRVGISGVIN
ncbi:trimeric autotransporter adhesin Ata [Acinetobacter baumannii]|uniref:trimeric autotransporter adhesin Ata n=2 Tax=Acinetobacter baumannii TaxID=470 RepID=UPI002DB8D163|nr:trimeric autotransporter adhesin Ata [Acinetobacter baumannii]MEB6638127.1 trimeric autotransporter adhesin Ata [Acinetobacter baumannii]